MMRSSRGYHQGQKGAVFITRKGDDPLHRIQVQRTINVRKVRVLHGIPLHGRYDLPGADGATLFASIREQLLTLADDYAVYPGHGNATTIGYEKQYNPYVGAEADADAFV